MNKLTVILNDHAADIKAYISFDRFDVSKMTALWSQADERLKALHVLEPFRGYERWSELTPNHYRLLITRGLNVLAEMSEEERADTSDENVSMTNFLILSLVHKLEIITGSKIESFKITRFDTLHVTFDYSAAFEATYERPQPKTPVVVPDFSIIRKDPE
jgi:hypothetical protein